jgi:hypothetical protein
MMMMSLSLASFSKRKRWKEGTQEKWPPERYWLEDRKDVYLSHFGCTFSLQLMHFSCSMCLTKLVIITLHMTEDVLFRSLETVRQISRRIFLISWFQADSLSDFLHGFDSSEFDLLTYFVQTKKTTVLFVLSLMMIIMTGDDVRRLWFEKKSLSSFLERDSSWFIFSSRESKGSYPTQNIKCRDKSNFPSLSLMNISLVSKNWRSSIVLLSFQKVSTHTLESGTSLPVRARNYKWMKLFFQFPREG